MYSSMSCSLKFIMLSYQSLQQLASKEITSFRDNACETWLKAAKHMAIDKFKFLVCGTIEFQHSIACLTVLRENYYKFHVTDVMFYTW